MQFLTLSHQLWETAVAILLGLFLGAVFDLFRFVRKLLGFAGAEILIANILDILFLLFSSACYCVFTYACSSGHFRWFCALGVILGFFLYRAFPSRIICPFLSFLADKIVFIIRILFYPLKMLISIICLCVRRLFGKIRRNRLVRKTNRIKSELPKEVKLV